MTRAVAQAYNVGLGAEPLAGSRDRASGQGVKEAKAGSVSAIMCKISAYVFRVS